MTGGCPKPGIISYYQNIPFWREHIEWNAGNNPVRIFLIDDHELGPADGVTGSRSHPRTYIYF
jgi:hypothetical protein